MSDERTRSRPAAITEEQARQARELVDADRRAYGELADRSRRRERDGPSLEMMLQNRPEDRGSRLPREARAEYLLYLGSRSPTISQVLRMWQHGDLPFENALIYMVAQLHASNDDALRRLERIASAVERPSVAAPAPESAPELIDQMQRRIDLTPPGGDSLDPSLETFEEQPQAQGPEPAPAPPQSAASPALDALGRLLGNLTPNQIEALIRGVAATAGNVTALSQRGGYAANAIGLTSGASQPPTREERDTEFTMRLGLDDSRYPNPRQ